MLNVVKFAPQAYEKSNATPVYANSQLASKKAPLYFQYYYGSTPPAVKKLEAVKLDNAGKEVSRTILTNFISIVDNSYISDTSVSISPELDENCIYYFEFTNDSDETFRTNVFETFRTNVFETFAPPQLVYSNGVVEDKETGEEPVKGLVSVLQFKVLSDRLAGVATFTIDFEDGSDSVTTQAGFQNEQSRIVSVEKVINSAGSFTATVTDDYGGSYQISYTVQDAAVFEVDNYADDNPVIRTVSGQTAKVYPGDGRVVTIDDIGQGVSPQVGIGENIRFALVEPEKFEVFDDNNNGEKTPINLNGLVNLTELQIRNLAVTNITIDALTKLTRLQIYDGNLESINLSNNTSLTELNLNNNSLTELDIAALSDLQTFDASSNDITTLIGLTGKTSIVTFDVERNNLTSINISDLTSVETLNLRFNNNLNELGVAPFVNNTALKIARIEATNIGSNYADIDITNNPLLEILDLQGCGATSLTTGTTIYDFLTYLDLRASASFAVPDLSNVNALETLIIDETGIKLADISFNTSTPPPLDLLSAVGNSETVFDISLFDTITFLRVGNNDFDWSDINFGSNPIEELQAGTTGGAGGGGNSFTFIDTNSLASLKRLSVINGNILSFTDITLNTGIEAIDISDNPITSETLDFTAYSSLTSIIANDTGNNDDIDLTGVDLTGMSNLQTLEVQNNSVSSITALTDATALQTLDLRGNALSANIAFTGLTALANIYLQANSLPSLSALNETNVKNIDISDNAITQSAEIDEQLNACVDVGNENGSFDSTGGTNAAPTATGEAAKNTLEKPVEDGGLGWTVSTA